MIKNIAVTPYNTRESLGWIIRNLTGFSGRNAGVVDGLSSPHIFNGQIKGLYRVVVVGDILPMWKNRLAIDEELKEFIVDSDYTIGDFEGTITEKKSAPWPIAFDQRHDADIVEMLKGTFEPGKTYLSVSNNHAGDFGKEEFAKSVNILKSAGFNLFGWDDNPYADINNDIRVVAGTMWSNRAFAGALPIDKAGDHIKRGAYNIFYPHMGYELELYPRPEIAAIAKDMAGRFDAVIASHPHCPQPVTEHKTQGLNKIIAYSTGNFCSGLGLRTMQYGLIIKMEIGKDVHGRFAAGSSRWKYTECVRNMRGHFMIRGVPENTNPFL